MTTTNTSLLTTEAVDAAIARGKSKVNVIDFPFCVRRIFADNSPGMHGWRDDQVFFATEREGLTFLAMPFTTGQTSATLSVFVDVEPTEEAPGWRWGARTRAAQEKQAGSPWARPELATRKRGNVKTRSLADRGAGIKLTKNADARAPEFLAQLAKS